MATGQDLVDAAAQFVGQRYSTAPGRDDPASSHKDCSGLIAAAYLVATGELLGANVSVTIFDLALRHGLEIPFEQAVFTPGACLLMPEDPYQGWGSAGHIGFSDGNGGTVEATPPRVQRLSVDYQPWGSRACLLPGITYYAPPPVEPALDLHQEDPMRIIKNSDLPDGEGWWFFPPLGAPPVQITATQAWYYGLAGVPHGACPGPFLAELITATNVARANLSVGDGGVACKFGSLKISGVAAP